QAESELWTIGSGRLVTTASARLRGGRVLITFRCSALFFCTLVFGYASQKRSASALTPADQLPLKYTALFGHEAQITAIAVDADGSAYIAGTASSALPVTAGAFQTAYKPGKCITSFP